MRKDRDAAVASTDHLPFKQKASLWPPRESGPREILCAHGGVAVTTPQRHGVNLNVSLTKASYINTYFVFNVNCIHKRKEWCWGAGRQSPKGGEMTGKTSTLNEK